MSGFRTHMFIGAVGGLAAFKVVEHVEPTALSFHLTLSNNAYTVPGAVIGLSFVVCSAYLALWPDVDEPRSHVSHRVGHFMGILGGLFALLTVMAFSMSIPLLALAGFLGWLVGRLGGQFILQTLRMLSGGHRHLTHSLVVCTGLILIAMLMYSFGYRGLMLPVFGLAWGQLLHLAGDVVTPGGVPLFYPLSRWDFHFLPYAFARHGEQLVGGVALLIGLVCLRW